MRKIVSVAFAGILFFSMFAHAQRPSQSAKFADSLSTLSEGLAQSNRTLLDMWRGMPTDSADQNAVSSITDELKFISSILDHVQMLAIIHGLMKSPNDQITVKKFLGHSLKYALKINELALTNVNRYSVLVKSAAAVAEIQKVRKILQRHGKEMQQLASMQ